MNFRKRVEYGVNWMELVWVGSKDGFSHMDTVALVGNNVDIDALEQTKWIRMGPKASLQGNCNFYIPVHNMLWPLVPEHLQITAFSITKCVGFFKSLFIMLQAFMWGEGVDECVGATRCSGWSVQIQLDVSRFRYGIYFSLLFLFQMMFSLVYFFTSERDFSLVVQRIADRQTSPSSIVTWLVSQ